MDAPSNPPVDLKPDITPSIADPSANMKSDIVPPVADPPTYARANVAPSIAYCIDYRLQFTTDRQFTSRDELWT